MAYSTSSDLTARLPVRVVIQLCDDERLADDSGTLAAAEVANPAITTRLAAAIADADTEIDVYLRKQVSVPVAAPVPATLVKLSADLTVFNLHSRRQSEFPTPEAVRDKRRAAIEVLKGINDGTIDLGIEPPPAASSAVVATSSGAERVFTVDTLEDF